ncbi:MAG: YaiO family outer membrane beta-barrel protein [Sulfuricella sp.]
MNNSRYAYALVAIVPLFGAAPALAVTAPATGYDQQIRALNRAIRVHDDVLADRLMQGLRRQYKDNPEVTAIWLRMQCSRGDFKPYDSIGKQAAHGSRNAELEQALQSCQQMQRLAQAQQQLDSGDAAAAIRIAQPLYASGPDPYRAGLILAKAYVASHQTAQAQKVYADLAQRYPKDTELAAQAGLLRSEMDLTQAQQQLGSGDAVAAIRIAQPLYASGPDPYRAGLILAKAYVASHQTAQAQKVYADLAQRYPKDTDLAAQSVVLLAQTHQSRAANQAFQALTPDQKHTVLAALADDDRALYPYSLTINGGRASSSGNLPGDDDSGLHLRIDTRLGAVVGDIEHAHRFGQSAISYGAHYYQAIGAGYGGEIAVSHSPSGTFLARDSLTLALSKDLDRVSLYASVRHLIYANAVANVLFGGVGLQIDNNLTLKTGLFYVPETSAYSIMLAPIWQGADGSRTFAYLTAGMAGEQLGVAGSVLRTPSYSIKVGHAMNVNRDVTLMGDIFYEHRAGLYNRSGIEFAGTKRW